MDLLHNAGFYLGGRAMKKRLFVVALMLVVFSFSSALFFVADVLARPTTAEEAKTVVLNWLHSEAKPMQTALGGQIRQVKTFADSSVSPAYYVVFLYPAGLVFVSADDLVEPIIGFVSEATDYDPSPSNPLGALVSGDIPGRILKAREMESSASPDAVSPTPGTVWEKARSKWERLESPGLAEASAGSLANVSDVRIAPLVQSKWSQGGADGSYDSDPCYNYYTPPYKAGSAYNYPCGCTATAIAQLMRFFQFPTQGVGTASFGITVNNKATTRSLRGGNGSGGPYNWAEMPLTTGWATPLIKRQAIGALTADAGVSVNMKYTATGSSAWSWGAFTETFGYSNAMDAYNSGGGFPEDSMLAMFNPNLDARHPILVDISGSSGGHAIVCDGYGYNISTLYHHLNMGWLGSSDAWYNLPTVITTNSEYNKVYGATYNIFVTGSGEIISGRVTDYNNKPVSGALVAGTPAAGGKFTAQTDSNGIYALLPVPSDTKYTVSVTKQGYTFPTTQSVSTGSSTQMTVTTGNVWGIDFAGSANYVAGHFAVSAPSSVSAGKPFNFTVQALDPDNNVVTNYSDTVTFTSSDAAAKLPADSTLINGTRTFSATLHRAGNQTITATDIGMSVTGTSSHIKVGGGS
jgi:hypothetical protein